MTRAERVIVNESGNTIPIAVTYDHAGVTVTATGPTSRVEHTWTPKEAATVRDLISRVLADPAAAANPERSGPPPCPAPATCPHVFHCPACGAGSCHPGDAEHSWCGACGDVSHLTGGPA
jgi:hypothetical protein